MTIISIKLKVVLNNLIEIIKRETLIFILILFLFFSFIIIVFILIIRTKKYSILSFLIVFFFFMSFIYHSNKNNLYIINYLITKWDPPSKKERKIEIYLQRKETIYYLINLDENQTKNLAGDWFVIFSYVYRDQNKVVD